MNGKVNRQTIKEYSQDPLHSAYKICVGIVYVFWGELLSFQFQIVLHVAQERNKFNMIRYYGSCLFQESTYGFDSVHDWWYLSHLQTKKLSGAKFS